MLIKESCNLIIRKAHLATPNQNRQSHILPSLDDHLQTKNVRDGLIPSRDIDDKEYCNQVG